MPNIFKLITKSGKRITVQPTYSYKSVKQTISPRNRVVAQTEAQRQGHFYIKGNQENARV